MFWSVPLSTKQKKIDFYYNFVDVNNNNVSVILAQIKLISIKRLKRKMYELSNPEIGHIKDKIKSFI